MDGLWLGNNQRVSAERLAMQYGNYLFYAMMGHLLSHHFGVLQLFGVGDVLSPNLPELVDGFGLRDN